MRTSIVRIRNRRAEGEHPGLLLNRYLADSVAGGGKPAERSDLLNAALAASGCGPLQEVYARAFARWDAPPESPGRPRVPDTVTTPPHSRLIVGLGQKGVLEAGLRLHHTYGVPFVPGSALKGLAAHYAHEVCGRLEGKRGYLRGEGNIHRLLFGTTEESGCVRFDDALPLPGRFHLHQDVMTPHHPEWQTNDQKAPTDFDSPVPVSYLSASGTFRLAVSWQGPPCDEAEKWTRRAMRLLALALSEWGVGGKTSSGYGRLATHKAQGQPLPQKQPTGGGPKRNAGGRVKVKLLALRDKPGFEVQEEGRAKGTIGPPPQGTAAEVGIVVDVFIHVDDPRHPQYKWEHDPPKAQARSNKPRR